MALDRERSGGLLPPSVLQALLPGYRARGIEAVLLMEMADRVVSAFRSAGIPALVVKGAALIAEGAYGEPAARPMSDVDLLVSPERVDEAVELLFDRGFVPWTPWSPGRVGWLDSMALTAPGSPPGMPLVLDLHWRLSYSSLRFGPDPAEEPLLKAPARTLSGRDGLAGSVPPAEEHLVLVLEHVSKHLRVRTHLPGLADAARLCPSVTSWPRVVELAARRRSAAGVGTLLGVLARYADAPVPAEAVRSLGSGKPWLFPARRVLTPVRLALRDRPVPGRVRGVLLRASLSGSPASLVRDARHLLMPSRGWLRARYPLSRGGDAGRFCRFLAEGTRWMIGRGPSPVSPDQAPASPVDTPRERR